MTVVCADFTGGKWVFLNSRLWFQRKMFTVYNSAITNSPNSFSLSLSLTFCFLRRDKNSDPWKTGNNLPYTQKIWLWLDLFSNSLFSQSHLKITFLLERKQLIWLAHMCPEQESFMVILFILMINSYHLLYFSHYFRNFAALW